LRYQRNLYIAEKYI